MLVFAAEAGAEPRASLAEINPFSGLFENAGAAFSGWNLALDLAGVAMTPVLVKSGADIKYHNYFYKHPFFDSISCPGFFSGFYLPYALGGGLMIYGLAGDAPRELAAACAVLQAGMIGFACQGVLKAFTGRTPPDDIYYSCKESSTSFNFGFMENGIIDGWPSGHMMTITASLISLWPLYPDSAALKISSGAFLFYLLVSVSAHDGATEHWLSELVVGTGCRDTDRVCDRHQRRPGLRETARRQPGCRPGQRDAGTNAWRGQWSRDAREFLRKRYAGGNADGRALCGRIRPPDGDYFCLSHTL